MSREQAQIMADASQILSERKPELVQHLADVLECGLDDARLHIARASFVLGVAAGLLLEDEPERDDGPIWYPKL